MGVSQGGVSSVSLKGSSCLGHGVVQGGGRRVVVLVLARSFRMSLRGFYMSVYIFTKSLSFEIYFSFCSPSFFSKLRYRLCVDLGDVFYVSMTMVCSACVVSTAMTCVCGVCVSSVSG